MIAKQTAFFTGDRKNVVAENDPAAKFLFVREGSEVADSEVAKYPGAAELIGSEPKPDKKAPTEDAHPHKKGGK